MDEKQPSLGAAHLIEQILRYIPGGVVPAVVAVVSAGVFTRLLSTTDYGQYSLVLGFAGLATALSSRWLEQSISRYLPEARLEAESVALKEALVIGMAGAAVAVFAGAICVFAGLMVAADSTWIPIFFPAALFATFSAISQPALVVLQAEMKAGRYSNYQLVSAIVRFALCLVFVISIRRGATGLLWGSAITAGVLLPFIWKDARLRVPVSVRAQLPAVKKLAAYGIPMVGWFLSATLLGIGDRWVIQLFRGASEVGIYSANYGLITGGAGLIGAPILLAAHPFLMRAWGDGDQERTARWLGLIAERFLLCGIVLTGGTLLFAQDLARWFLGSAFQGGYVIMGPVLAGTLAWQLGMYAHKPLEFYGKTRLMLALSLGAAFLNMVLNFIFVPRFGYVAAAYTTLASYLFYVALAGYLGRQFVRWSIRWAVLFKNGVLISLIGFLFAAYMRRLAQDNWGYIAGLVTAGALSGVTIVLIAISHGIPFAILRRPDRSK